MARACGDDCPAAGTTYWEAVEVANRKSDEEGLARCYALEGCGLEMIDPLGPGAPGEVWACSRAEFLGPDCEGYRLPSRAEWELAARAGSPLCLPREFDLPYIGQCLPNGPTQTAYAIWCANSDGGYRPCIDEHDIGFDGDMDCVGPMPVRTTRANDFGLHEVFGNVSEYTQTERGAPVSEPAEPRWQPPFPVDDEPEFLTTVTGTDSLSTMGGDFTADSGGACGYTNMEAGNIDNVSTQRMGFRLVRTT